MKTIKKITLKELQLLSKIEEAKILGGFENTGFGDTGAEDTGFGDTGFDDDEWEWEEETTTGAMGLVINLCRKKKRWADCKKICY